MTCNKRIFEGRMPFLLTTDHKSNGVINLKKWFNFAQPPSEWFFGLFLNHWRNINLPQNILDQASVKMNFSCQIGVEENLGESVCWQSHGYRVFGFTRYSPHRLASKEENNLILAAMNISCFQTWRNSRKKRDLAPAMKKWLRKWPILRNSTNLILEIR